MANIDKYKKIAKSMIQADTQKDAANRIYDDMFHCDWRLPEELAGIQWMRAVVSTDVHDAESAGTRVLSTLEPRVNVVPLASDAETKRLANEWEINLKWQLKSAEQRRQGGVVRDITHSAIRYDEVIVQVVDLDYQIKQLGLIGANTNRYIAARRYGRFMINTFHPSEVSVRYSDYMPEAILLHQEKTVEQVMSEWGKNASGLKEWLDDEKEVYVILYDYTDYDVRVVWAVVKGGDGGEKIILPPTKNELPFINWVAMVGGTTLEKRAEHRRHPLAYSVLRSGGWVTQNIVKSLAVSEVIRNAGSKREVVKAIDQNNPPETNDGDPAAPVVLGPQEDYNRIPPHPIDRALIEVDDRISAGISRATVSQILQNADVGSNVAFATLNLATQTAVGALKPYKELAEKALSEVFRLMLFWVYYTKSSLLAYSRDRHNEFGQQYMIEWDTIAPDSLYIEVELTPDVPTDRLQRVNAASIAVNSFMYPIERALEDIGVNDPEKAMEERRYEMIVEQLIGLQIQQIAAQAQQMMQPPPGAMPQPGQQELAGPSGIEGLGGPGFNPAMGGLPPAMAAPDATRELQAMRDNLGYETGAV